MKTPSLNTPTASLETDVLDREAEIRLMNQIAAGDRQAFDDLSRRYGGLIYATVHKVLNHFEDTRDICQEVLLSIWKKGSHLRWSEG